MENQDAQLINNKRLEFVAKFKANWGVQQSWFDMKFYTEVINSKSNNNSSH